MIRRPKEKYPLPVFDRLAIILSAALLLALSCLTLGSLLGWDPAPVYSLLRFESMWTTFLTLILVLLGLHHLNLGLRQVDAGDEKINLVNNDFGEIRITGKAVERLIRRVVEDDSEVQSAQTSLIHDHDGLMIRLELALKQGVEVPTVTAALQDRVCRYLESTIGMTVSQIHIDVKEFGRETEITKAHLR